MMCTEVRKLRVMSYSIIKVLNSYENFDIQCPIHASLHIVVRMITCSLKRDVASAGPAFSYVAHWASKGVGLLILHYHFGKFYSIYCVCDLAEPFGGVQYRMVTLFAGQCHKHLALCNLSFLFSPIFGRG